MTSLGELLSKTANEVYMDLKSMLTAMKTQDAELRTSVMKLFILHSRKKLAQCYSLIRWLSVKGVSQKLHSITDLNNQLSSVENGVNQQLDELFFSHASIYSMRCSPYNFIVSANVLSSGSFDGLPLSIFTCGLPVLPSLLQDETNITEQLDIYIAAKLALNENLLLLHNARADIVGGVVCVTVRGYFEVHLSLAQLNVSAQWITLGCRLLAQEAGNARADNQSSNHPNFAPLEENMTRIANEHLAAATRGDSDALARVLLVCRHAALAASLRIMHGQAVDAAAGQWSGLVQVQLDEQSRSGVSELRILLWLNPLTREYTLGLSVSHNRKIGSPPEADRTSGLLHAAELFCELTVRNVPPAVSTAHLLEPNIGTGGRLVRGFGVMVPAEKYVRGGVRFCALLEEALHRCATLKVKHLAERLRATLSVLGNIGARYEVMQNGGYLLLSRTAEQVQCEGGGPVGVTVEVDVRGGKFVLSSARAALGQAGQMAGCQHDIDLFAAEINNVESEQLFGRFLLGDVQQPDKVVPITTVEVLLRALDLCHWDRIASAALKVNGAIFGLRSPVVNRSTLDAESRTVVYCVAEWESVASVKRRHLRSFSELFEPGNRTSTTHVARRNGKRTFDQFSGSAGTSNEGGRQSAVSVHLELSVAPGSSSLTVRAVLSLGSRDGDLPGSTQPQKIDVSRGIITVLNATDPNAVSQWLVVCAERAVENAISVLVPPVRGVLEHTKHGSIAPSPSCITTLEEDAGAVRVSLLSGVTSLGGERSAGTAFCQMRVLRFPSITSGDSQRKYDGCQWLVEDLNLLIAEGTQLDHELCRVYEVFLRELVERSLAVHPLVGAQGGLSSLCQVLAALQPLLHLLAHSAAIADSRNTTSGFLRPVNCVIGGDDPSDVVVLLAVHSRSAQSVSESPGSTSLTRGYVEVTSRLVQTKQGSVLSVRDVAVAAGESQEVECLEAAEVVLGRVLEAICTRSRDSV